MELEKFIAAIKREAKSILFGEVTLKFQNGVPVTLDVKRSQKASEI